MSFPLSPSFGFFSRIFPSSPSFTSLPSSSKNAETSKKIEEIAEIFQKSIPVEQDRYKVIRAFGNTPLSARGITTSLVLVAIGLNQEENPLCFGLAYYAGARKVAKEMLGKMKKIGAERFKLCVIGGFSKSEDLNKENLLKDLLSQAQSKKEDNECIPAILNPYKVDQSSCEAFDLDLMSLVGLMGLALTVAISPKGEVYLKKNNLVEKFDLDIAAQLQLFIDCQKSNIQNLAKEYATHQRTEKTTFFELLEKIKKYGHFSSNKCRNDFIQGVLIFYKEYKNEIEAAGETLFEEATPPSQNEKSSLEISPNKVMLVQTNPFPSLDLGSRKRKLKRRKTV